MIFFEAEKALFDEAKKCDVVRSSLMQHKHSSGCCRFSSSTKEFLAIEFIRVNVCVDGGEKGKRLTQVRVDLFPELK